METKGQLKFPSPLQGEGQGGVERCRSTTRVKKGDLSSRSLRKKLRSRMTPAEEKLWYRLRGKRFEGFKFRRQHGIGPYIVDYYCPERSLVIEIDGDVHAYEKQIKKDFLREKYLKKRGLQVVRYTNQEVLKNLEGVLENLYARLVFSRSTSP
ncbi:MAG TPA: hypothetical protein DF383_09705 [Deltaproteobacteria bacterium]|nr:hypothetical protein [Deltaproteobacteria bacterium]